MKTRAFTIIELLVVVSIVGLISSVILGNLTQARQRAVLASAQQFDASVRHAIGDRLVGSWNFNESGGNTAFDDSGNNLNGTVAAGASYAIPGVDGTGSAIFFSGSNSYVNGTGAPTGDNIGVTVSAWLNPTDVSNNRTIFITGNGSCTNYGLSINSAHFNVSNNFMTIGIDPGGNQNAQAPKNNDSNFAAVAHAATVEGEIAQTTPSVPNNEWTSVVTSFAPDGTVTSYVNGKYAGTATGLPTTNCGGNGHWSIGAIAVGAGVTAPFIGRIDNVAVYEGTVTALEAARIYALGAPEHKLATNNLEQ